MRDMDVLPAKPFGRLDKPGAGSSGFADRDQADNGTIVAHCKYGYTIDYVRSSVP